MGKFNLLLALLIVVAIGVGMSVFTVNEREHALKFRFGEIIRDEYDPGLHFKIPVVNNIVKLSNQVLTRYNPPEEFLTAELKNLRVDFFIKWRIIQPGEFYRSTRGDERVAAMRLVEIVKDGLRGEFARRTVQEVVSLERAEMMDAMLARATQAAGTLGIEIIDIRVKRIDLPDEVSDSVFNRMRQERARVAADWRARGVERSDQIRADADRQQVVIRAEARRGADPIRGDGQAPATHINAPA
ncbi:MAG: protease modulator HflC, partial [Gammaproteobacteria bacterium]|nr:protease modulator HflC [Gammaproteobacteria bacterium]